MKGGTHEHSSNTAPILIVEPDLSLRTSITYQIRQAGYAVLALGSAALAREVVRVEEDPEHPQLIQTVCGTGYRFQGEAFPNEYAESAPTLLS